MGKNISLSIPYKRQCFNPQVAAYLQAMEKVIDERFERGKPQMEQAIQDLMLYGTGTVFIPGEP